MPLCCWGLSLLLTVAYQQPAWIMHQWWMLPAVIIRNVLRYLFQFVTHIVTVLPVGWRSHKTKRVSQEVFELQLLWQKHWTTTDVKSQPTTFYYNDQLWMSTGWSVRKQHMEVLLQGGFVGLPSNLVHGFLHTPEWSWRSLPFCKLGLTTATTLSAPQWHQTIWSWPFQHCG